MSCSSFRDWNRGLSLTLAKIRKEPMGQLPGEILKDEFLNEIGVSRNQPAQAIGVPGNRLHAIFNGTRDITADTDLIERERSAEIAKRVRPAEAA
jgi:addiction module HigA family antidote